MLPISCADAFVPAVSCCVLLYLLNLLEVKHRFLLHVRSEAPDMSNQVMSCIC